ncbi:MULTISPECIES: terminus macrodomain insulation protein YfbV [unclassified Thalassotalea]|uniref:terminus macrodomain insulation protein YfbV n=1 Tax=unclassified Thalassotalea TaxID=2614972 RepID=UPI001081D48C|nr:MULTISPECIES: terminus macrodomain insulation protein YfbV [unclassified Thalassotalea]NMP16637.1 DUF412 family protein [Thalassotalea sp. Y01]QBY03020.1 DUF412 family protein [Thalassotalea sp. HSM 43]
MQQHLYDIYKTGVKYIDTWPKRPELINYFPQYRAVLASRFVLRYAPPLAALAFILPLMFFGVEQLKQALFYGIFIASMPFQAVVYMAKQAKELLPPSLANWYRQGVEKLKQEMEDLELTANKPTYHDLATLLNYSYNQRM